MGRFVGYSRSPRVAVPQNTVVTQGKFAYLDGVLGMAVQSVTTGAGETGYAVLQREPGIYETDQIKAADAFAKGDKVYWDTENKRFTTTPTSVFAGRVATAKANGLIDLDLQPGILGDEAMSAIGAMGGLTTDEKDTVVGAINEVDGHADTAQADVDALAASVGDLEDLTTEEQGSIVGAINEVDTNANAAQAAVDAVEVLTQGTPTITVGAEAGDKINVAVQLKDAAGANLAAKHVCRVWLSDAAAGALCAVAPSGDVAIGTDGVIVDSHVAKTHLAVVSSAQGKFDLDITEAGDKTLYLNLEYQGKVFSSAAITFAA